MIRNVPCSWFYRRPIFFPFLRSFNRTVCTCTSHRPLTCVMSHDGWPAIWISAPIRMCFYYKAPIPIGFPPPPFSSTLTRRARIAQGCSTSHEQFTRRGPFGRIARRRCPNRKLLFTLVRKWYCQSYQRRNRTSNKRLVAHKEALCPEYVTCPEQAPCL